MKTEKIDLELYHYIDKDFKCELSKLLITKTINGKSEVIEIRGIDAEAVFNLVSDFTKPKKENADETSGNIKK